MKDITKKDLSKASILGILLNSNQKEDLLSVVTSRLASQAKGKIVTITTPNPEQVVLAQTDDTFKSILNRSTISLPDGTGIVLAHKLLNYHSKSDRSSRGRLVKIPGIDFMLDLVSVAHQKNKRVFLLGAKDKIGEMAAKNLKSQFPGLKISSFSGPSNIKKESARDRQASLDMIKKYRPDILIVAYGAPYQERWVDSNKSQLEKLGVKVAMVVGGSLDIIAGKLSRAPKFIRSISLEWLFRLGQEPWRWKRQLKLLTFAKLVIKQLN